jgi:hypothetical protein
MIPVFAASAVASDINGNWLAQVTSPNGSKGERLFTFHVAGYRVTGTIASIRVSEATFEEKGKLPMTGILKMQSAPPQEMTGGKITEDDVSFAAVSRGFMGEMRTNYKARVSGNEIKFTVEQEIGGIMGGGPGPQQIVARKLP